MLLTDVDVRNWGWQVQQDADFPDAYASFSAEAPLEVLRAVPAAIEDGSSDANATVATCAWGARLLHVGRVERHDTAAVYDDVERDCERRVGVN